MRVIQKPIITEKSMMLAKISSYTFMVDENATKQAISRAVENKFKVNVLGVRIINKKGAVKMQRRVRKYYQAPSFKKAIVQLKKGQTIALFETPKEEEVAVITAGEQEPVTIKERKNILRNTKVRIEKGTIGASPTTQRKVIPT